MSRARDDCLYSSDEDEASISAHMISQLRDDSQKKVLRARLTALLEAASAASADASASQRHYTAAETLLNTAHKAGLFELVAWNRIATEYKKRGRFEDVLRIFRHVRDLGSPPDVISYNIAIDALGKAHQFGAALELFEEMRAHGLSPTVNTITSLIDTAGKANSLHIALDLLKSAIQDGVRPNVCTFTSLMTACMAEEAFDTGLDILKQMGRYVLDDPLEFYVPFNAFILRAGRALKTEEMMAGFDEMMSARLSPPASALIFAIGVAHDSHRADLAWRAFGMLVSLWGEPPPAALSAMAWVCVRGRHAQEALGFVQQMLEQRVTPDERLLRDLLQAAARAQLRDPSLAHLALSLLHSMRGRDALPSASLASLLVDTAARCQAIAPAAALLELLLSQGVPVATEALVHVIDLLGAPFPRDVLASLGTPREVAVGVVRHFALARTALPRRALAALIRAVWASSPTAPDDGVLGLLHFAGYTLAPSELAGTLLEACADTHDVRTAASVASLLATRRLTPNLGAARAILGVCIQNGDLQSHDALQLAFRACGVPLAEMLSSGCMPIHRPSLVARPLAQSPALGHPTTPQLSSPSLLPAAAPHEWPPPQPLASPLPSAALLSPRLPSSAHGDPTEEPTEEPTDEALAQALCAAAAEPFAAASPPLAVRPAILDIPSGLSVQPSSAPMTWHSSKPEGAATPTAALTDTTPTCTDALVESPDSTMSPLGAAILASSPSPRADGRAHPAAPPAAPPAAADAADNATRLMALSLAPTVSALFDAVIHGPTRPPPMPAIPNTTTSPPPTQSTVTGATKALSMKTLSIGPGGARVTAARELDVRTATFECVVCLLAPPQVVFLPCGHVATCASCAADKTLASCPMCHAPIRERRRVWLQTSDDTDCTDC